MAEVKSFKLSQFKNVKDIEILKGTIFDVFGGIPQAFVGIDGEAGAGKSQTLMRLIADVSKQEPVLVVLTEQSLHRWSSLFKKYIENNIANPNNIRLINSMYYNDDILNELKNSEERIIFVDSLSGWTNEQNARKMAKDLRAIVEFKGKWVIGTLQVRGDNVAGGEGVKHMIEVLYTISYFQLKPQNKWLYGKLEKYGYEIGDYVRLIRNDFDKIKGVSNNNIIVVDINRETGIVDLIELGKKEYSAIMENNNNSQTE